MNVFKEKEEDSADALPAPGSSSAAPLPLPVALGRQTSEAATESPSAAVGRAEGTEAPGRRLVATGGLRCGQPLELGTNDDLSVDSDLRLSIFGQSQMK